MEIAHFVAMCLDCHCLVKYSENASWRSIIKVKKEDTRRMAAFHDCLLYTSDAADDYLEV